MKRHKHDGLKIIFIFLIMIMTALSCNDSGNDDSDNNGTETGDSPVASFTISESEGTAPLTVAFDASASTDSDGTVASYAWDFGDGSTGTGVTTSHTFTSVGTYTVQLTVTDDSGNTDAYSLTITATEAESGTPVASLSVSTDIGSYPLYVTFSASGSSDDDGYISRYTWDFGDGSTGSGSRTTHTYRSEGNYTVTLTVTDNSGLTATSAHIIEVKGRFSLSGYVAAGLQVLTDSDVNDTNSTAVSNDSFAEAQSITAPCSLSGYVNERGAGSRGLSYYSGDTDDYYLVSLNSGMVITLYMAEKPSNADLSLYLYDENQKQIDASLTEGESVDELQVTEDGTYYVRVEATEYASNYVLILGQENSVSLSAKYPLLASGDFVPGEVLVRFESSATSTIAAFSSGTTTTASSMGFLTKKGISARDKLLKRSTGLDKETFFKGLGVQERLSRSLSSGTVDSETAEKIETLWMIRGLREQEGVVYAEPNYIRKSLSVTPDDPYYKYQWHYSLINLPDAWEITTGEGSSGDVIVGVVDTGVLLDHPDLDGQLVDGYDFISDTSISNDGDGVDDDPDDPGDEDVGGSSFHGTHVAGTIAASTDNAKGVAGVSWNAKIMPLRVLGVGGGTSEDILEAIRYAAGLDTDAGVTLSEPVDVLNLSFGGEGYSQIEAAVYEEAREQGVIIIAAAGNSGSSSKMYPAAYDSVVSVSAVTLDESLASYSNYGSTISVAAPGGNSSDSNGDGYIDGILSTIGNDNRRDIEMTYAFSVGTSMAAPHVAGVVALMKAVYPGMTPDTFDQLLAGEYLTQDLGDSGWDEKFGYGMIDAYKAVLIAEAGGVSGEIPSILSVSPKSINLGTLLTSSEITVKNAGGGTLTVTGVTSSASWLTVEKSSNVDATTGLGTYSVTVSRDGLSDGTYSGTITCTSDSDSAAVSVVMQVSSTTGSSDAGHHYILLLEPDTLETVDQVSVDCEDGIYEYEFTNLSYGDTYVIYAGTDPDNDGGICGDGESCGAYLSQDDPVEITVTEDLTDLIFNTDLIVNMPDQSTSLSGSTTLSIKRKDVVELAE